MYSDKKENSLHRGYQRVGENITKGVPDMHEAIDVGLATCFTNPMMLLCDSEISCIYIYIYYIRKHSWYLVL